MDAEERELAQAAVSLTAEDFVYLKEKGLLSQHPEQEEKAAPEPIQKPRKKGKRRRVSHRWPEVGAILIADYRGQRYEGPDKEKVTVRHLLTHSSGIDWWAPLFEELQGPEAYIERIQAMDLVYEPGSEFLYSDLGMILLGEILSRVAGRPLHEFVSERVFEPLAMTDTLYRPGVDLLPRIAPTEFDPKLNRVIHGEVHDENTRAMGGIAPHAGLFGTAGDLARFTQMILNGGVFEHHRFISSETVEMFTKIDGGVPDSDRALGWDTKSAENSSAGQFFSPNSYGHTGFTGPSLWIDFERGRILVLLTNRHHPGHRPDNNLHPFRRRFHRVATELLESGGA